VLGCHTAFFGLVASGWTLDDFAERGASGRLPPEAHWAEALVGVLDRERAGGMTLQAVEINELVSSGLQRGGVTPLRLVTDGELERIRRLRDELHAHWLATEPGGTLEVLFPARAVA
jgi:hypothetical protein